MVENIIRSHPGGKLRRIRSSALQLSLSPQQQHYDNAKEDLAKRDLVRPMNKSIWPYSSIQICPRPEYPSEAGSRPTAPILQKVVSSGPSRLSLHRRARNSTSAFSTICKMISLWESHPWKRRVLCPPKIQCPTSTWQCQKKRWAMHQAALHIHEQAAALFTGKESANRGDPVLRLRPFAPFFGKIR